MPDETIEYPSADGDGPYYQGAGGNAPPDGNFVVAETGAGTKLMEWDATTGEWVVRGPVAMSGNDVTGVGELDADSVSTESVDVGSHESISGIEFGTVSNNSTIIAGAFENVNVSFENSFSNAPSVVVSLEADDTDNDQLMRTVVRNISTSGFQARFINDSDTPSDFQQCRFVVIG